MFFLNGDLEQFAKLQSRIIEWVLRVLCVSFQGIIPASLDYAKDMTVRVHTLQAE